MPCLVILASELCTHCGMAQVNFGIVFTCCDTDHHERGSCFAAFVLTNTAPVSSSIALCLLGFGVLSWFSNPVFFFFFWEEDFFQFLLFLFL